MMKVKTEMLTLNEQKYLVELYEDIIGEWLGTGSGDGLFGDYEIGGFWFIRKTGNGKYHYTTSISSHGGT